MDKLTLDNLRAMQQEHLLQFPHEADNAVFRAFILGSEILIHYLGAEWARWVIISGMVNVPKKYRNARNYMKIDAVAAEERFRLQDRICYLAELLFNLQDVPGIDLKIEELKVGNVEPTFAELHCASMLYRRGLPFQFISPIGAKGSDYDIKVDFGRGAEVFIEIKAKLESTTLNENTLRATLNASREGLPKGGTGITVIRIPEDWVKTSVLSTIVRDVLARFFRQTTRVMAVIFCWETWTFAPDGSGMEAILYRVEHNPNVTLDNDVLAHVLAAFSLPGPIEQHERAWFYIRPSGIRFF